MSRNCENLGGCNCSGKCGCHTGQMPIIEVERVILPSRKKKRLIRRNKNTGVVVINYCDGYDDIIENKSKSRVRLEGDTLVFYDNPSDYEIII